MNRPKDISATTLGRTGVGMSVIAPVGGGRLDCAEPASRPRRTCGAGTLGQMEDNVRAIRSFRKTTTEEIADVRKTAVGGAGVYTGSTLEYWKKEPEEAPVPEPDRRRRAVGELATQQLSAWHAFYAIVGSAGGAVIAVQFVVITIVASMRIRTTSDTLSAFGTPTVVHLSGTLLLSAIMSAPWPSLYPVSIALVASGLVGLGYTALVIRRAHRQTDYEPVGEDWLWHAILPCGFYVAVAVSAILVRTTTDVAMFVLAAAVLGLLLIGIHNAWDSVTHIVVASLRDDRRR